MFSGKDFPVSYGGEVIGKASVDSDGGIHVTYLVPDSGAIPIPITHNDKVVGEARLSMDDTGLKMTGTLHPGEFAKKLEPDYPGAYSIGYDSGRTTWMSPMFKQASRYGEQVRLLEDQRMDEDRAKVRKAWRAFLTQTHGIPPGKLVDAYYEAYER